MSDERSLFDSFERLVNARLKCMETLALSVMKRTTSLEDRLAALEQPHTPVEATPVEDASVESQREHHGRLLYGLAEDIYKDAPGSTYVGLPWDNQSERSHDFWRDLAEWFVAEVQPLPTRHDAASAETGDSRTILEELLQHGYEVVLYRQNGAYTACSIEGHGIQRIERRSGVGCDTLHRALKALLVVVPL